MNIPYTTCCGQLAKTPQKRLVTGVASFTYAVAKYVNKPYAEVFARSYGFATIDLRYFNIFGPLQDSEGAFAAVVPKWTAALHKGDTVYINGDGETSRYFCYVANAVQANLLAATSESPEARNQVYNVAVGDRTTLNALFILLRDNLAAWGVSPAVQPIWRDFRTSDVRHSPADIDKAQRLAELRAHAPVGRRRSGGDPVVCRAGEIRLARRPSTWDAHSSLSSQK